MSNDVQRRRRWAVSLGTALALVTLGAGAAAQQSSRAGLSQPRAQSERSPTAASARAEHRSQRSSDELNDARIAHILAAADHNEIQSSLLAQQRATDARVQRFAGMMVEHHTRSTQQLTELKERTGIVPEASPLAQCVQTEAIGLMVPLQSRRGADFDRAYMNAQVVMHEAVLRTIDHELIPNAQNPELASALRTQVRPMVAEHLSLAHQIREQIGGERQGGMRPIPGAQRGGGPGADTVPSIEPTRDDAWDYNSTLRRGSRDIPYEREPR